MYESPTVIAVVEDDEGMRQAMRRVLEIEGFSTEVFESAEAFLAAGAVSRAQCLVLDVNLPGISGIELHTRLRTLGRWIPTVFVTAQADKAREGYLIKPFPAEALIHAVKQSISKGRDS